MVTLCRLVGEFAKPFILLSMFIEVLVSRWRTASIYASAFLFVVKSLVFSSSEALPQTSETHKLNHKEMHETENKTS